MSIHCELLILILTLTLDVQVHTGEIIGGQEAVPHSRPYMVLLERYMQDGKTKHCGGFLLNEDFVMTAAHCQASSYTVLLGVHNFYNSDGIQRISVVQTFPRKDYNETDLSNDIMLLKLSSKAKFSTNVRPIALAGQDDGSLPKSCIISGWGKTNKNIPNMSAVLMEANVTLIDSKQCPNTNVYCSEGETGPGKGDSGGPLVCEDRKVYGVVSSFYLNKYVYAKIPDYRSWIDLIMNQH
ncbi:granzyme G-like isoform X1 [Perca fluviatilis]|uniref:granzyme G-like isoform X1 n=1 Tax=Perca fluviatilis TaxID=8168 RepID=UPI0019660062|nr:granzyme G-like isoform X1 [Perca fluviatilis]XP_039668356.1 granzyme G-like isoform X1 [Perca fluviatilis]